MPCTLAVDHRQFSLRTVFERPNPPSECSECEVCSARHPRVVWPASAAEMFRAAGAMLVAPATLLSCRRVMCNLVEHLAMTDWAARLAGRLALLCDVLGQGDAQIFADDVVRQHPYLKQAYEAKCPQRTDLGTMKKKASDGAYTACASPKDSIAAFRDDCDLIHRNCIAFNGNATDYGRVAHAFLDRAHAELDKMVAEFATCEGVPEASDEQLRRAQPKAEPDVKQEPADGTARNVSIQKPKSRTDMHRIRTKARRPTPFELPLDIPVALRFHTAAEWATCTAGAADDVTLPAAVSAADVLSQYLDCVAKQLADMPGAVDNHRAVINNITIAFNQLALATLLFEPERRAALRFIAGSSRRTQAEYAWDRGVSSPAADDDDGRMPAIDWCRLFGVAVLLRLVFRMPQLLANVLSRHVQPPQLVESTVKLTALPVIEGLLVFIAGNAGVMGLRIEGSQ